MGKVTFSGIGITDINGSTGNRTIQRNAYGTFIKQKNPQPTQTSFTANWQAFQSYLVGVWQNTLSDADRLLWYEHVLIRRDKMGGKNRITGLQSFMSVNSNLQLVGMPTITAPPSYVPIGQIHSCGITGTAGVILNVGITGMDASTTACALYATPSLSPGRMSHNQTFHYFGAQSANGIQNYTAAYVLRFGALGGFKIFLKAVPIGLYTGARGVAKFDSHIF